MKSSNFLVVSVIILITSLLRLVPGIDNFNPFTSIALFGSAYFIKQKWAYIIPLAAIYLSDFILNNTILRGFYPNHEGLVFFSEYMISVYIAYILIIGFGKRLFSAVSKKTVLIGVLGSTAIFYLLTNFGAWVSPISIYPKTIDGLLTCMIAGIPFVQASFLSNLIFSSLLFGGYELFKSRYGASEPRFKSI